MDYYEFEDRLFIHKKNISVDELNIEYIKEIDNAVIWNTPDKMYTNIVLLLLNINTVKAIKFQFVEENIKVKGLAESICQPSKFAVWYSKKGFENCSQSRFCLIPSRLIQEGLYPKNGV